MPDEFESDAIEKIKEFMTEQSSRTVEERFNWEEGDATLPAGWKMRVSDGEAEMQWFLSPEGFSYRSRYTAVQDMIKRN